MSMYDKWVGGDMNKEEWMKYYAVKVGGMEGRIKAYNRQSAEQQMDWIVANQKCFCRDCTKQLLKDYYLYMDTYNKEHISDEPHIISGFMQG